MDKYQIIFFERLDDISKFKLLEVNDDDPNVIIEKLVDYINENIETYYE